MARFSRDILMDEEVASDIIVNAFVDLNRIEEEIATTDKANYVDIAILKVKRDTLLELFNGEICAKYKEVK